MYDDLLSSNIFENNSIKWETLQSKFENILAKSFLTYLQRCKYYIFRLEGIL